MTFEPPHADPSPESLAASSARWLSGAPGSSAQPEPPVDLELTEAEQDGPLWLWLLFAVVSGAVGAILISPVVVVVIFLALVPLAGGLALLEWIGGRVILSAHLTSTSLTIVDRRRTTVLSRDWITEAAPLISQGSRRGVRLGWLDEGRPATNPRDLRRRARRRWWNDTRMAAADGRSQPMSVWIAQSWPAGVGAEAIGFRREPGWFSRHPVLALAGLVVAVLAFVAGISRPGAL